MLVRGACSSLPVGNGCLDIPQRSVLPSPMRRAASARIAPQIVTFSAQTHSPATDSTNRMGGLDGPVLGTLGLSGSSRNYPIAMDDPPDA